MWEKPYSVGLRKFRVAGVGISYVNSRFNNTDIMWNLDSTWKKPTPAVVTRELTYGNVVILFCMSPVTDDINLISPAKFSIYLPRSLSYVYFASYFCIFVSSEGHITVFMYWYSPLPVSRVF